VEILDVLETYRADEATVSRLFGREGLGMHHRGEPTPQYLARLREAADFVADIYTGRKPAYLFREAMTTSDFPLLFGDILDRQLLGNYNETPITWPQYVKRATVRDFRQVQRHTIDGAETILEPVAELTEYPEAALTEGRYRYSVNKYGRRMPFSWETMINDDMDALKDVPERFGRAARRSEEKFATGLFVASTGPDATFFSNTNKNLVNVANGAATNNPALSIAALQEAMIVLSKMVDSGGDPIAIEMITLVVPPALQIVAENILNATELWLNEVGGVANQQVHTVNWMRQRTTLAVNYYLPIINTTSGNTAWYLFASTATSRPALELGFLRGHEEPEVFMKSPNAIRVGGGGLVDPMNGDFDTDAIEYKIRHVFGGTQIDPKAAVASKGTGAV
jgi:hypothetical protein